MKIGLLTFFRPINYGAVLQACALNSIVLPKLGGNCELIDYRLPRIEYYRKILNVNEIVQSQNGINRKLYLLLANIYLLPKKYSRIRKFDDFIQENLQVSPEKYYSFADLAEGCQQYDCYIVGSDLVWNPEMTGGVNPAYYFQFVNGKKKISYAASIGTTNITESELTEIVNNIQSFDFISVRERQTALQLQSLSQKQIEHVLDPTLLTDKTDWESYTAKTMKYKKNTYIFAFMLEQSELLINAVNMKAKDEGLDIVTFGTRKRFDSRNVIDISWGGPDEFLEVMKNAKYVFTNSFHGCAFSLIFEKEFYCIPHTTRGVRMIDLMNGLDLSDHILSGENVFAVKNKINYSKVEPLLKHMKEQSMQFLRMSLGIEEDDMNHENSM